MPSYNPFIGDETGDNFGASRDVGVAAERRALVVDQVMAEYRAYCAGELSALFHTSQAPDGRVEYCGADEDPAHCAISYVRASNDAVVPLAVGHEQRVAAEFDALDRRCVPVWDPLLVPTPVALLGGREYPFKAARGRHLLGVVELENQAVLLAAADDRLVAVLVVDGKTTVVPLGRPLKVREVDVDLLRAWARPHAAANSRTPDDPLRPSAGTRAHHIRIVPGRRVELGEGLTLSQLLEAMFADIEARATTPPKPPKPPPRKPASPAPKAASADAAPKRPKRPKLKGKTWVPYVLRYLWKMALEGSLDLVGLSGTIIAAIRARFPEFRITGEAFADALKLIAAVGTCLIAPHQKGERIWRIHLEGLSDPTSAQHRRLCRETRGRVRVEEAAANQRSLRADAPAAGEGPPSNAVDADATPGDATDKTPTSPDEPRDMPTGPDTAAPDADRSASQMVPAGSVSAGPLQEMLELIHQLSMIPGAAYLLFLVCRVSMTVAELLTAAAGNDAASARFNTSAALDATGPSAHVDAAPHADEAVVLDASGDGAAPVDEAPPAGEAVASDGVPPVEEAPGAGDGVPPVEEAPGAGDGAAAEAPSLDELLAPAVTRDDGASDGAAEDAFAPVQPEPRCRDLGTLGPRGPPAFLSG